MLLSNFKYILSLCAAVSCAQNVTSMSAPGNATMGVQTMATASASNGTTSGVGPALTTMIDLSLDGTQAMPLFNSANAS